MSVSAEGREDHRLLTRLLGLLRESDRLGDGVGRLGRGHDALRTRELHRTGEALRLRDGHGVHEAKLINVRDERRHAVVAQATGVNGVGDEVMAQRVHLHQRGHARGVAEVVGVHAARQRWA